ncbi:MAG: DUF3800 domain-containing protein [archaeon]
MAKKNDLYFYLDDSGQPGFGRGLRWHVVGTVYTADPTKVSKAYNIAKNKLMQINPKWKNFELKGVEMDTEERTIVLVTLKESGLSCYAGKCDTSVAPTRVVKNRDATFTDTKRIVDSAAGAEARHFAFLVWGIINPIKNSLSKVVLYYDGKKFRECKELKEELATHLERQLGSIPFEIHAPDSEDCEGIQLADVLANSYYKHAKKPDSTFKTVKDYVKQGEMSFNSFFPKFSPKNFLALLLS